MNKKIELTGETFKEADDKADDIVARGLVEVARKTWVRRVNVHVVELTVEVKE